VNVKVDGFILTASTQTGPRYSSSGLNKGSGISGNGEAADASGAFSKMCYWDL
jgi:hypothetical protein